MNNIERKQCLKVRSFSNATSCLQANSYRYFEGIYALPFQNQAGQENHCLTMNLKTRKGRA